MNFQRLNEAFDRKYAVTEEAEVDSTLSDRLYDKMFEIQDEIGSDQIKNFADMKKFEIGFQEVIEELYPGKPWWEVTDCQIFQDLFEHVDPDHTIRCIIDNLKITDAPNGNMLTKGSIDEAKKDDKEVKKHPALSTLDKETWTKLFLDNKETLNKCKTVDELVNILSEIYKDTTGGVKRKADEVINNVKRKKVDSRTNEQQVVSALTYVYDAFLKGENLASPDTGRRKY